MPNVGGIAGDQLRSIIERAERLEEEIGGLQADKRELFAEAKANGFDLKAIKEILKLRKKELAERQEQDMVVSTYMRALGMLPELDDE